MELDWEKIAPEIAVQILGEPTSKSSTHWRFNRKGSLALDLASGTFFDFENGQGFGLIEFIKNRGLEPDDFLKEYKPIDIQTPIKPTRTFTDKDM